jgi:flagellar biosynthetic protein FlhB
VSDAQERTERPTTRRLARARAEGRWPSSAITGGWLGVILAALPIAAAFHVGVHWIELWRATASHAASFAADAQTSELMTVLASWIGWTDGWVIAVAAAAAAIIAAVGAAAASGALAFAPAALRPRMDRLSWSAGARQLVSTAGAAGVITGVACSVVILWCAWLTAHTLARVAAAELSLGGMAAAVGAALRDAWWKLLIALAAPVCFDVWQARRRGLAALRMTPREVREERAEAEGKPEARARRRAHAASASRNVQIGAIRRATAVVANPTHVAVALRYAPPLIQVPIVVSRGADLAAALVRAAAALHDVPVIESPELARALYASVALGEPIPEECYAAVVAVFAWLLHTRGTLAGADDP